MVGFLSYGYRTCNFQRDSCSAHLFVVYNLVIRGEFGFFFFGLWIFFVMFAGADKSYRVFVCYFFLEYKSTMLDEFGKTEITISIPSYTLNRIASCLCRRILSAILSEQASYRGISECKRMIYKVGRIFCVRRLHSIEVRLRHLNALVVEKHIRNVSVSHSTFCALSKSLDKLLVCSTE